jgi:hypothetical protein
MKSAKFIWGVYAKIWVSVEGLCAFDFEEYGMALVLGANRRASTRSTGVSIDWPALLAFLPPATAPASFVGADEGPRHAKLNCFPT